MLEVVLAFTLLASLGALLVSVAVLRRIRPVEPPDFSGLTGRCEAIERAQERVERSVREEIARNRGEQAQSSKDLADSLLRQLGEVRTTVDARLQALQDDNGRKLELMRQTVDEKLQGTLEKRLGESFQLVSHRLEQVHKGLGEMQTLAAGVGDLKRVLSNVKLRGTWGEVQLGAILEQIVPGHYEKNVAIGEGRVEFAIRLPGNGSGSVWIPIDSKYPHEDYQRLVEASERSDTEGAEGAAKELERNVRLCAKTIAEKYIRPPHTTDFALLFLPTEGLYSEVLRRPGLAEHLQVNCRVVLAGPTTFAGILNSLRMGFQTLAIQQKSSEVWDVLAGVKGEFGKYGEMLDRIRKKLDEASTSVEDATRKNKTIEKRLRDLGNPLLN